MTITRRTLSALLLATALAPVRAARAALPPAQAELVRRIETYLNGVTTMTSRFSQVSPDGSPSSGAFYVDRSRSAMRFDYDPPSRILLLAPGDWRLIFQDALVRQENVLPVNQTPLGFLLEPEVRLTGHVSITEVRRERGEILMTVLRSDAPDQGRVILAFREQPIELRRWAVTDPQGLTTVIVLEGLQINRPIDSKTFTYRDPKIFGWPTN